MPPEDQTDGRQPGKWLRIGGRSKQVQADQRQAVEELLEQFIVRDEKQVSEPPRP
jgi:hypothetical protein